MRLSREIRELGYVGAYTAVKRFVAAIRPDRPGALIGISHSSVQRIWNGHGLKPHLSRTFKVSNDPDFANKVEDIVGLYLDPPEKALVLAVDEKSQIQALDRTQPGPLSFGVQLHAE